MILLKNANCDIVDVPCYLQLQHLLAFIDALPCEETALNGKISPASGFKNDYTSARMSQPVGAPQPIIPLEQTEMKL